MNNKKYENRKIVFNQMVEDAVELKKTHLEIEEDEFCVHVPMERGPTQQKDVIIIFDSRKNGWIEMMILEAIDKRTSKKRQWLLAGKSLRKWAWLPLFNRRNEEARVS